MPILQQPRAAFLHCIAKEAVFKKYHRDMKKNADGYLKKLAKINHLAVQNRAQVARARGRCGENSWREIVGCVEMVCDVGVCGCSCMPMGAVYL